MTIPAFNDGDDEPVPNDIVNSNVTRGWFHAWNNTKPSWRAWRDETRPRLYYPASLQYHARDYYVAVDGMGRQKSGTMPYACTVNPASGKFERLTVQTRDSFCTLDNSTWDRTIIRNTAPRLFRLANFPLSAIPLNRRHKIQLWTGTDWVSVMVRWVPASLAVNISLFLSGHSQPRGKDPRAYLPFLYNGYRYPRLARNFGENRREIREGHQDDPSWTSGEIGTYRAFRPRFLCYLIKVKVKDGKGNDVWRPWFEVRPVRKNDHTPYVFISYTKDQFGGEEQTQNYQYLYARAIRETTNYADSVQDGARKPKAFWLDGKCQPHRKYIEGRNKVEEVTDEDEQKLLTDQDVYTMSDIIRGAEHTIVIAWNATPMAADDPNTQTKALQIWGQRVWTLPEVILSKGDSVTTVINLDQASRIPKVRLAEIAWPDAGYSRQLVEHFTNLPLSRLELVSIAMKCLEKRKLRGKHRGDRSYALMGLLRVRPRIDTDDSSFQAFARLSLPQDNDRLMERLICLLPRDPDEPWNRMSDQYESTLWDIIPHTQVCGIGENDTVIVDGFKGAMIQWSRFSTVSTTKRMSWKQSTLIYITALTPVMISLALLLLVVSRIATIVLLVVTLIVLLAMPAYIPYLYTGKLYEVEPCLFGIEGYVPLPEIEELMFGARMGRLKWSPYGSPLSRHRYRKCYREHILGDVEAGSQQPLLESRDPVYAYPVEAMDPCSPCDNCTNLPPTAQCTHLRDGSAEAMSKSPYGSMKLFTLIDTFSMTATLFEARHPPVALIIGGSEGGMKRALACSYDMTTGTLHRETVLRVPSQIVDKMHCLQRVRLGLKNPLGASDVSEVNNMQPVSQVAVADSPPQAYKSWTELESLSSRT